MALQLSLSSSPSIRSQNLVPSSRSNPISSPSSLATSSSRSDCSWLRNVNVVSVNPHGSRSRAAAPGLVRCSLETAIVTVGQVTEVDKDTFWPIVNAAGDKAVVLDMYTQWCGPCKIIAPKFQELSEKYLDVVFLKLDCNQDNKPLAKELGIRVVPTFKILKHGKIVKEVTGAKLDDLVLAIDTVRSG